MTEKEFDVLLELSAFYVDSGERATLMQDVESILGYVSQLPASSPAKGRCPVRRDGGEKFVTADGLRNDEVVAIDAKEVKAVRKAFPAITSDGLLEVQDVFGSKDV